jgi:enoyl-CoA hydratase
VARVNKMADNPRSSVASLKQALHAVRAARRGAAVERERQAFSAMWGGTEHIRAMNAFLTRKQG